MNQKIYKNLVLVFFASILVVLAVQFLQSDANYSSSPIKEEVWMYNVDVNRPPIQYYEATQTCMYFATMAEAVQELRTGEAPVRLQGASLWERVKNWYSLITSSEYGVQTYEMYKKQLKSLSEGNPARYGDLDNIGRMVYNMYSNTTEPVSVRFLVFNDCLKQHWENLAPQPQQQQQKDETYY